MIGGWPSALQGCSHRSRRSRKRLRPIDPSARLELNEKLNAFPVGYRHLAYAQDAIGYPVKRDMPGLKGGEVAKLVACGQAWLKGDVKRGEDLRKWSTLDAAS